MIWRQIKLGDAGTFINGYPFKPTDWKDSGLEIIRIQNLTGSSSQTNYYSGRIDEKYKVKKGDLLISWSATLGIYEWERLDGWLNQHIFKVVFDKHEFDKTFFKYLISSKLVAISEEVHGSTMKHITKKRFDDIKIPLPPLPTQKKIAAILDAADDYRQKTKALAAKYDQLAQSLFLEMFGDPVRNGKGWKKIKLEKLAKISSGSTPSRDEDDFFDGQIPWVKTGEVNGSVILRTEEKITQKGLDNSSCRIYPSGSLIIAMYGQGKTRGQIGLLGIDATTNQACAVIPPSSTMNYTFLFSLLKMSYEDLRKLGRGGNQPNLNSGMIKDYEVINPPITLQTQFATRIQLIEAQKQQAQSALQKSEELFNSLLQKAFKGELVAE